MRNPDSDYVAALPMYDFDELAASHESLWAAIASRLAAERVIGVPTRLSRDLEYVKLWRDPRLLLGQACEFPLAKKFAGDVRVVATPMYGATGCEGARYRSAIVVSRNHPAVDLAGLRDTRCVINAIDSNSGMNLLRAAVASSARDAHFQGAFFSSVIVSGAHRRSAEMIAHGAADVAALDCVTLAHLQNLHPGMMSGLRVLGWTPSSPSLPFITARSTSEDTLRKLRSAVAQVVADPALAEVRARLYLVGVDVEPDPNFTEVLHLEQQAIDYGYPVLE